MKIHSVGSVLVKLLKWCINWYIEKMVHCDNGALTFLMGPGNCLQELRDRLSVYEESEADDGSVASSISTSTRRSTRSRDSQAEMVGDLQKQLASKASQLGKLSEEVVAIKREAEVRYQALIPCCLAGYIFA